jgi:hypothetical protein
MPVSRFNNTQCSLDLFTTHRFLDDSDRDLWSRLTPWFENNKAHALIITAGEVDIRAHYWRHIPRSYSVKEDIVSYVSSLAERFYSKLCHVSDTYGLEKIVIWGSPTCRERAPYNSEYPFVGSAKVRNILTHVWNRELCKSIQKDHRFSFASAFYNFIDKDYITLPHSPSHDGVHWSNSQGSLFWNTLILPALSVHGIIAGGEWSGMLSDEFDMAEYESIGNDRYDTWARTDQLLAPTDSRVVEVNKISYTFVRADDRRLLPARYTELGLAKL